MKRYAVVALLSCSVPCLAQYVTLTGHLQAANGLPASNFGITFTPSQLGFVAGTGVVVNSTTACATSVDGAVVGIPNPLTAPHVTTGFTGTLPAGNYYVRIAWYDANGNNTLASKEVVTQLSSAGRITVAPPSSGLPAGAVGMRVYVSVTANTETLQGSSLGSAAFIQQIGLVAGAALPTSNATICRQVANDSIWPVGTGYTVALIDSSGNTYPGYPMQWQLLGAGSTINLSTGLPYYNGTVVFPSPILATPLNNSTQSIAGPLSLSGYPLLGASAVGVGTLLPAWAVDVENGFINSNLGYRVGGSAGNSGDCLASGGNAGPSVWGSCGAQPVAAYGAVCDWNGTTGTDDTAAFQAAASAANALYVARGAPVAISVAQSCVVNGTVTIGSGVRFTGPGRLIVQTQTGGTLLWQNADYGGVDGLTIQVTAAAVGNNANISAISWRNTFSDTTAHQHFFVRNTSILGNANWGILIDAYQGGVGSALSDIDISGNTITSPTVGSNADGIHVGGLASNVTIRNNRISNRNDAAIAVTAEPGINPPHEVLVDGNVLTNNLVGLDCSGCRNTIWANNYVTASSNFGGSTSNPAARAIYYLGSVPLNVKFEGNYLVNTSSIEFAAKLDPRGGATDPVNVEWIGNTIGPAGLAIYGNSVVIAGNTFQNGSTLQIDADSSLTARNITVGPNAWLGSGSVVASGNPSFYANNLLAKQSAPTGISTTVTGNNLNATFPLSIQTTLGSSTSDVIGVGMLPSGSTCALAPTNVQAANNTNATYIASIAAGQVVINHPASISPSMTFTAVCTPY